MRRRGRWVVVVVVVVVVVEGGVFKVWLRRG